MISIIIPTYNSAKTIQRCLDSIIRQTYKDYEVLVMDGCSMDGTVDIIRAYKGDHIYLYSEPDKGIYDAMNKGIKCAKGDWLYFLGSDDYLFAPDVLEKVAEELTLEYKIVYGEVEAPQLWEENKGAWKYEKMEYNRCHQAIFYKRDLFEKYGLYDLSYKLYADFMYNLKCFWKYQVPSKYVPITIANYSDGGASVSGDDPQFYKDVSLFYLRYGTRNYSINQRKELAYEVMRNSDSKWLRIGMRMCVYYLRLIDKFYRLAKHC